MRELRKSFLIAFTHQDNINRHVPSKQQELTELKQAINVKTTI